MRIEEEDRERVALHWRPAQLLDNLESIDLVPFV